MLIEMKVKEYLDTVASSAPAPGGGSASALCGAQGAGLCAMVAALTLGKKKFEAHWPLCEEIAGNAKDVANKLTAQIDADTDAYNLIAAAFKLPKDTDGEKAARKKAIAEATLVATKVPLETLSLSAEGLRLVARLMGGFNTNCASDLGVAALDLAACARGAWLNVLINLPGVEASDGAEALRAHGAELLAECEALFEEAYKSIKAIIE